MHEKIRFTARDRRADSTSSRYAAGEYVMSAFEQIKAREEKVICHTYGRYPLAIRSAKGCRLEDADGREYVDLLAGIAVVNVGHGRPELTEALTAQAAKLGHVSNLFYTTEQLDVAEKLLASANNRFDRVFFCNSGAEANEAAIKIARRYAQKIKQNGASDIITFEGAFHGRTLATVTATGQPKYMDGFAPMPQGFVKAPWGDPAALEAAVTPKTAAVMMELVQGEGGVRPASKEFAHAVSEICKKHGLLLILDEVQTGLCRTGRFWAHQHYDVQPDIMTSAKALANGLPMGAMLCTEEVAKAFVPGTHASTFGGGPLVSAVASKTLDIMKDEKLAQRADELGEYAKGKLKELAAAHPDAILDVRGLGLLLGVEFKFPAKDILTRLFERGFVCNVTHDVVLRLVPPLVISKEDIDAFIAALEDILKKRA